MRKVTASAVILTALTGCSQSGGIPSTQWSFQVPTVDKMGKTQVGADETGSVDGLADKFISARLDKGQSASTKSDARKDRQVADARSVVSRSTSARFMGPAFEQPEADSPVAANISTADKPNVKEVSSLSSETYGLANGLGTAQASTRPDPVAQVRAYLRSGNPSALTNRTPYSSQVYLSSLPVPNQYYDPASPVADFISNDFTVTSAAASTTELPVDTTLSQNDSVRDYSSLGFTDVTPPATSNAAPSLPELPGSFVSSGILSSADYPSASDASSYLPQNEGIGEAIISEGRFNDEGLPQLTASASVPVEDIYAEISYAEDSYSSTIAVLPEQSVTEIQPIEVIQPLEEVPTSTISLSDLGGLSDIEPVVEQTISEEPLQGSPSDFYSESVSDRASAYSPPVAEPTLVSLAQTMPERDLSPLVASFRAGKGLSELSPTENIPAPYGSESSLSPVDVEAGSTEPYSLLLKGLRDGSLAEASADSTIYVPIAEAVPFESLSSASEALSTLESKGSVPASTAAFISELAQKDVFSAVLSSQALAASDDLVSFSEEATTVAAETRVATHSSGVLSFDIYEKATPSDQGWQNDKARRAKLTPAFNQGPTQRQRLTVL